MERPTGVREPVPAAHVRGARDEHRERSGSAGGGLRMALVAGSVAAVAALGVATGLAAGSGARPPVIVAGAVLLAAAAGAALLAVWRCYTQPAARSARILAQVAGDSGQPDASLEAVAAAAQARLSRLEHANQRLSAVIGGLPQGVLVFGHDGTLLEINGTGAAMLGAAPTAEHLQQHGVANVSHELRTPITSISGFVETLLDSEMYNSAKARHFLEIIVKHSSRLKAIIDDLMSLANIELGEERRSVAFSDTALAPVISAAVLSCGQAAAACGVALQAECDPDLTCRMNAQLVEQALINLLDNAIKHSGRDARVVVRAGRNASDVRLEVTDTGIGIAPEHQQRIFERFYRVDRARSRKQGGTGPGLAIVKHIAQAHDGDVSVRSVVQRGSTFTLRLPG